jgi:hypothetical protein
MPSPSIPRRRGYVYAAYKYVDSVYRHVYGVIIPVQEDDMDQLFGFANLTVLPFWLAMIAAPRWGLTRRLMARPWGVAAPALMYLVLVLPRLPQILPAVARPELPAIAALLGTPLGATIAWAHFLAFDLLVGRGIYLDGQARGISAWVMSPILLLTLLLGPLGLLSYGAVLGLRRVPSGRLDRPLVLLATGLTGLLAATLVLMLIDGRQVLGASTWLKPAKFAASAGLTAGTLALLLGQMAPLGRGGRRAVGLIVATVSLELALITTQAARGVASHFNHATPVDAWVFHAMGAGIVVMTAAIAYLGWLSFRQRFDRPALGWGIRLGFVIMLTGSSLGGLMLGPTAAQRRTLHAGQPTPVMGAHAVGVADGGPGLPLTRWSTEGGDLRIPHFVGMHGLQLLPLLGWWLSRRRKAVDSPAGARQAARRTVVAGAGYLGLVGVTLLQALRGQPLLAPDALTLAGLALVLGGTAIGWALQRAPGLAAGDRPAGEGSVAAVAGRSRVEASDQGLLLG